MAGFFICNLAGYISESNTTVSLGLTFCFLAGCHSLSVQSNTTACGKPKDTRVELFRLKYWPQFRKENEIPGNTPICAPSLLSEWGSDGKKLELLTSLPTETLQYCRCPEMIYAQTV